jgi:hypothetical protein
MFQLDDQWGTENCLNCGRWITVDSIGDAYITGSIKRFPDIAGHCDHREAGWAEGNGYHCLEWTERCCYNCKWDSWPKRCIKERPKAVKIKPCGYEYRLWEHL